MVFERYFSGLREILAHIEAQKKVLTDLADEIAEGILSGSVWHIFDNGHFIGSEFSFRAGGLAHISLIKQDDVRNPTTVRAKDIVIIVSVSGRSTRVVAAAQILKERGTKVVALTSLAQAEQAPPEHPSGMLLKDVADVVIDMGGPAGDGFVTIEGLSQRICPASGIASAAVLWALAALVAESMVKRGAEPVVYTSANVPGGYETALAQKEKYIRRGY